jgi:hypothetical protein
MHFSFSFNFDIWKFCTTKTKYVIYSTKRKKERLRVRRQLTKDEWERAHRKAARGNEERFGQSMDKVMATTPAVIENLLAGKSTEWISRKFGWKPESVELLRSELKRGGKL